MNIPKLFVVSVTQAVVMVGVFTLFFIALGAPWVLAGLLGISFFALISLLFHAMTLPFFVLARIKGAVYVPSADDRISAMLELAHLRKGVQVVDLGSGDGRVMIAFAKKGAHVTGYEINPVLVKRSRENIRRSGLEKNCVVEWKSFWDVNLQDFDIVIVYGIPYIMKELGAKLRKELQPSAQILSNAFEIPDWKPVRQKGEVKEYRTSL